MMGKFNRKVNIHIAAIISADENCTCDEESYTRNMGCVCVCVYIAVAVYNHPHQWMQKMHESKCRNVR